MGLLKFSGKNLILCLLFISLVSLVYAAGIPGLPHQFYGSATINGNLADNALIVAKINGIEIANTLSHSGQYGFSPYVFFVTDPNNNNLGKTIEFYLNGTKVAEKTFLTEGYTRLDLVLGSAPVCGNATCDTGEDCGNCAADCGNCSVVPSGGGSGSGGSGGGGGGGGGENDLLLFINGNCVGKSIYVGVNSKYGKVITGSEIIVNHNLKKVAEETTNSDGNAVFSFNELGKYSFIARKGVMRSATTIVELVDCKGTSDENRGTSSEDNNASSTANTTTTTTTTKSSPSLPSSKGSCGNIDCDDKNPCTVDNCIGKMCSYVQLNDVVCGEGMTCRAGACVSIVVQKTGVNQGIGSSAGPQTGFLILGENNSTLLFSGIAVLLIIVSGYLFYFKKNFGKKDNAKKK